MLKLYQKKTDIEGLEKLMLQLGVEIDLKSQNIEEYDTPDYKAIK